MTDQEEDEFHRSMFEFMTDTNYNVSIIIVDCNADNSKVINELRLAGKEVFKSIVSAGEECKIIYRSKK